MAWHKLICTVVWYSIPIIISCTVSDFNFITLCFPSQSWPTLQVPGHREESLRALPRALPASHAEQPECLWRIPPCHPSHPQPFRHVCQGKLRQCQEAGRWAGAQRGDGNAEQGVRQDQDSLQLIDSLPLIGSLPSIVFLPFSCFSPVDCFSQFDVSLPLIISLPFVQLLHFMDFFCVCACVTGKESVYVWQRKREKLTSEALLRVVCFATFWRPKLLMKSQFFR